MNVLWLINVPLPEASRLMHETSMPFGGWLVNSAEMLAGQKDLEVSIAFPKNDLNEVLVLNGEQITYYAFPPISKKDSRVVNNNSHIANIDHSQSMSILRAKNMYDIRLYLI